MDKQHKLNAAITASRDVHHNIDALLNWVNDTEVPRTLISSRQLSMRVNNLCLSLCLLAVSLSFSMCASAKTGTVAKICCGTALFQICHHFHFIEVRSELKLGKEIDMIKVRKVFDKLKFI